MGLLLYLNSEPHEMYWPDEPLFQLPTSPVPVNVTTSPLEGCRGLILHVIFGPSIFGTPRPGMHGLIHDDDLLSGAARFIPAVMRGMNREKRQNRS